MRAATGAAPTRFPVATGVPGRRAGSGLTPRAGLGDPVPPGGAVPAEAVVLWRSPDARENLRPVAGGGGRRAGPGRPGVGVLLPRLAGRAERAAVAARRPEAEADPARR